MEGKFEETRVDDDKLWAGNQEHLLVHGNWDKQLGILNEKRKKWLSDKTWKLIEKRKCSKINH